MEYTKKHKNLIAKLLKKAGMIEEAKFILSCDEYKCEISKAMRDSTKKTKTSIGANPALLDAARRYETSILELLEKQLGNLYQSHRGKIKFFCCAGT